MQIEDFKLWHWMIIGALVGALFGAIEMWKGPVYDNDDLETLTQGTFERVLIGTPISKRDRFLVRKDVPMVENLTVHPPLKSDPANTYWITGRAYTTELTRAQANDPKAAAAREERWISFRYEAKTPYKSMFGAVGNFPTVKEYLNTMITRPEARFKYRYAFWELPAATVALPAVAGVLIIGIAWPLTIGLLQRGGMARVPQPKKAKLPKRRKVPVGAKKIDNSAKDKQLDDLNADLEASLANFADPTEIMKAEDEEDDIPMPVKKLVGNAGLASEMAKPAEDEGPVEYGGEFYPVIKAHHETPAPQKK